MEALDLEILYTFVIVTELGSYTKAASVLFKSQSAISEQIQKLEAFCDVQLLSRGRHGAKPTVNGEKMYRHAKKILALNDEIMKDIRSCEPVISLRLSITDYFMPNRIASILRGLSDQHKEFRFSVSIQSGSTIFREHILDQYDVALFVNLSGQQLPSYDNFVIVGHESLCWAGHKNFSISKNNPLPIITLPKGCLLQKAAIEKLENNKASYTISHYASSVAGMQSAIEAQLGIGCLNKSSMPSDFIDYTELYNLPPLPTIDYIMHYKSEQKMLIDEIRKQVQYVTM